MKYEVEIDQDISGLWYWEIFEDGFRIFGLESGGCSTKAEARAQGEAVVAALTGPARKPVKWHPASEIPIQSAAIVILDWADDLRIAQAQDGLRSDDVAWCYECDLAADARDAMDGGSR